MIAAVTVTGGAPTSLTSRATSTRPGPRGATSQPTTPGSEAATPESVTTPNHIASKAPTATITQTSSAWVAPRPFPRRAPSTDRSGDEDMHANVRAHRCQTDEGSWRPGNRPTAGSHRADTNTAYRPGVRVLVVEDEVRMAALIRRGLEEDGYAVDVATNGPDGLWQARERAGSFVPAMGRGGVGDRAIPAPPPTTP